MNANAPESGDHEQHDAVIGTALVVSLAVFILLGLVVAGGVGAYFFWSETAPLPPPIAVVDAGKREADLAAVPSVSFTDITADAGIAFTHTSGATGEKLLPETMGGGVAFFDYDNDGDQDLLFVNSTDWPWKLAEGEKQPTQALYQNDGHGKFTDVTADAGLDFSLYGMGVAVGDYDGDGWTDLFLSAVGQNRLLHNEQGKFVDVTETAGVAGADDAWSTGCCWVDYNNDGKLDLFVGNYVQWSREIDQSQGFTLTGGERAYGPPLSFAGTLSVSLPERRGGPLHRRLRSRRHPGLQQPAARAENPRRQVARRRPIRSGWRRLAWTSSWPTTRCRTSCSATSRTARSRRSAPRRHRLRQRRLGPRRDGHRHRPPAQHDSDRHRHRQLRQRADQLLRLAGRSRQAALHATRRSATASARKAACSSSSASSSSTTTSTAGSTC